MSNLDHMSAEKIPEEFVGNVVSQISEIFPEAHAKTMEALRRFQISKDEGDGFYCSRLSTSFKPAIRERERESVVMKTEPKSETSMSSSHVSRRQSIGFVVSPSYIKQSKLTEEETYKVLQQVRAMHASDRRRSSKEVKVPPRPRGPLMNTKKTSTVNMFNSIPSDNPAESRESTIEEKNGRDNTQGTVTIEHIIDLQTSLEHKNSNESLPKSRVKHTGVTLSHPVQRHTKRDPYRQLPKRETTRRQISITPTMVPEKRNPTIIDMTFPFAASKTGPENPRHKYVQYGLKSRLSTKTTTRKWR